MSKKKVNSSFYDSFIGEYVIVFINNSKTTDAISGYLIDVDDEYYLLGQAPDMISQAIKINQVSYITVADPNDVAYEDAPEKDKFN